MKSVFICVGFFVVDFPAGAVVVAILAVGFSLAVALGRVTGNPSVFLQYLGQSAPWATLRTVG